MKEKKIGMVTLYSDNYGSCLQAYALYRMVQDLGYSPTLIDYMRFSQGGGTKTEYTKFQKLLNLPIKQTFQILKNYRMVNGKKKAFGRFRKEQFCFTSLTYSMQSDAKDLASQFDAFLCGSDMMWSEEFQEDWAHFFLQFSPMEKRIAYAPSFGINQISKKNRTRCGEYLSGFMPEKLSCRDKSGVKMIEELFGLRAAHVVDPTMLYDKDEWNSFVEPKRMIKEPYVLLYLFGGQDGGRKQILEQLKKWKLGNLKSLNISGDYCIHNPNIGPFEFVRLFRDAEFILTDTFHGLMFSLIYEKPFVVLTRDEGQHWGKYSERMTAQLEMLGIPERYHNSEEPLLDDFKVLDYSQISKQLASLRKQSKEYLRNALAQTLNVTKNDYS